MEINTKGMVNEKVGEMTTDVLGVAMYPRLTEPDDRFGGTAKYQVKLRITDKEAAKKILDYLKALLSDNKKILEDTLKKKVKVNEHLPWSIETENDENVALVLSFKKNGEFVSKKTGQKERLAPVPIFDSKGKRMVGVKLGSGTEMYINFEVIFYYSGAFGCGLKLQPNAVQVLKLVEYTPGVANRTADEYGFSEQEGFESEYSDANEETESSDEATLDDSKFEF